MREYELIEKIAGFFPRSSTQLNKLFECDSEIIRIGDAVWALTMDEFSPEEDLFFFDNPEVLGNNLAVATLSDLFAAGAKPVNYMHTVVLPPKVDMGFVEALMEGIRLVLDEVNCFVFGGDLGNAKTWRYCGFAMGIVEDGIPLTHLISPAPQTLWVTGALGDANLAALQKTATPRFELRKEEAAIIKSCATSCIDTSGGLFDAIWLLHEQNPGITFDIQLQTIPYAEGIKTAAKSMSFPEEAALAAGAGEYELLFTVPERSPGTLITELEQMGATRIGTVFPDPKGAVLFQDRAGSTVEMTQPPPCPRGVDDMEKYVKEVIAVTRQLFAGR